MIRLLLVDDQRLMRDGLKTLLEQEQDLEIVGMATNGQEAVALQQKLAADVILMDIRMPVMNGIAATAEIMRPMPATKILMLTTFDDMDDVASALAAGAVGYLLKDMPASAIATAIRAAMEGGAVLPPSVAKSLLGSTPATQPAKPMGTRTAVPDVGPLAEPLTDREMEVLACLAQGLSNREIANQLFVTEGTVKNHVSSLIAKLGLRDRTQAALFAVRHGFGPVGGEHG